MNECNADRQRVLKKIIDKPGLPIADLEWELLRDGFDIDNSHCETLIVSKAQLQKYKKVSSRTSELSAAGKIKKAGYNGGYFPDVGAGPSAVARQANRDQARDRHQQMRVDPSVVGVSSAKECMALLGDWNM